MAKKNSQNKYLYYSNAYHRSSRKPKKILKSFFIMVLVVVLGLGIIFFIDWYMYNIQDNNASFDRIGITDYFGEDGQDK